MKEEDIQSRSQSSARNLSGYASVKIVGNLGRMPNREKIDKVKVVAPVRLGLLVSLLQREHNLELRRDSTLIMVNGVEARALEDLETNILPGDEVVLVPMFHGGKF